MSVFFRIPLIILLLTSSVYAQNPEPKAKITPEIVDFGQVQPLSIVEGKFTITNNGNAPLEIQKLIASCGCVVAESPKKLLEPGESSTLTAKFNSKGFFGPQRKNIRVYTNEPEAGSHLLTLKGEVLREFSIKPAQFFFGDILKGEERKVKINVQANKPDLKFGEIGVKSNQLLLSVSDSSKDGFASKTIELTIKPDSPEGILRSMLIIHTNSINEPVISVPVFAKIQTELQLSPSYISFDLVEGPLAEPISKIVELKNVGTDFPSIISINSDNPLVTAEYRVFKPGKLFEIEVFLAENSEGIIRATLTINTDRLDDSHKSVTLPVYAFIAKKGE